MKRVIVIMLVLGIALAGISHPVNAARPIVDQMVSWQGHPTCAGISAEVLSTPECDQLIAARPTPNVSPVPVNFGVIDGQSFIRFNMKEVPLYDQPNGTQVDTMAAGYTYVAPIQYRDGWAEIRPGRWVDLAITRSARPSTFSGVFINGLDMPFAWILWPHCATSSPNGYQACDAPGGQLQRYQLVNIYATVNVGGWSWYLIGPGLWTNQQNVSVVYPQAPAEAQFGGHWVGVNTYEQNLVAYDGSSPVMATLVSSGVRDDERWRTKAGTYAIRLMLELGPMNGQEGSDDFYSLDKVPYAMYFNGLVSLHGTYWHDSFGYVHSHGCVNLTISDAKWLFENWVTDKMTVFVYGD